MVMAKSFQGIEFIRRHQDNQQFDRFPLPVIHKPGATIPRRDGGAAEFREPWRRERQASQPRMATGGVCSTLCALQTRRAFPRTGHLPSSFRTETHAFYLSVREASSPQVVPKMVH